MRTLRLYGNILLAMLMALSMASCGGDDDPASQGGEKPIPAPVQGKIDIPATENTQPLMAQTGGTATVTFTANGAWTASTSAGWCMPTPASGQAGTVTLTLTALQNGTYDDRVATITLKCGNASQTITVSQVQKDAIIVALQKHEVDYKTTTLSFEVQHNVPFQVTISDDAKDWISQTETRALQTDKLTFSLAPNEGTAERTGVITVEGSGLTQTVKVVQNFDYLAAERAALMDLYHATNGDNWKDNTNWGSELDFGQWVGVSTDKKGHVIDIVLSDNNLEGTLPENLPNLPYLTQLWLPMNKLTGEIPESIGGLKNLTSLSLAYNQLTGEIPESMGYLTELNYALRINDNMLTGNIPLSFLNLVKHPIIDVSNNCLDGDLPRELVESDWWKKTRISYHQQEGYQLRNPAYYNSSDFSQDRKVEQFYKHGKGKGIKLVITGDAYSDRNIADGTFRNDVMRAIAAFFSVEPYNTFKNYFDIYAVTAVSTNEILGADLAFKTENPSSGLKYNFVKVMEYVSLVADDPNDLSDITTIVLLNTNESIRVYSQNWSNGFTIGLCTTGDDLTYEVTHEIGGHGFGLLGDEYVDDDVTENDQPDDVMHALVNLSHNEGEDLNLDYHKNLQEILWADFISNPDYDVEHLGAYEGGWVRYPYGIYRPTKTSIMREFPDPQNPWTMEYNAPSRWAIYQRLMKLAGENCVYEEFLSYDKRNLNRFASGAYTRSYVEQPAQRRSPGSVETSPVRHDYPAKVR